MGYTPSPLVRRLATVALVGLATVGISLQAARGTAGGLLGRHDTPLPKRDAEDFMATVAPVMPIPVVPLTREDAIAQELLINSRTLSPGQALLTAHALCEEAQRLGEDPLLFLAVIYVESSFDHLALSPVGALGLMQLMPDTAADLARRGKLPWDAPETFDPVLNVRLGARYISDLQHSFHNHLDLTLTAYNRGPGATRALVQDYGGLPPRIRDFYATRVLGRYKTLKATYGRLPAG